MPMQQEVCSMHMYTTTAETIQDTSHRERKKPVVRAPGTLRSQVAKTSGASAHFQHKMRATLGELHRGDKYF